jgi:ribonuclease HI
MELSAVLLGLESVMAEFGIDYVEICSDSAYVVNAFKDHWVEIWAKRGWTNRLGQPVKNADLWKRLIVINNQIEIRWTHVKGHSGLQHNEAVDELCGIARLNRQTELGLTKDTVRSWSQAETDKQGVPKKPAPQTQAGIFQRIARIPNRNSK